MDMSLSIRFEPVLQCDLKKGDRVFFPDRNETYEVSFVDRFSDGRWDVHLLQVLDGDQHEHHPHADAADRGRCTARADVGRQARYMIPTTRR